VTRENIIKGNTLAWQNRLLSHTEKDMEKENESTMSFQQDRIPHYLVKPNFGINKSGRSGFGLHLTALDSFMQGYLKNTVYADKNP
jgi:hypothetical protein